ncbi:Lethal(2)neighbour of tid protein [Cryptotermes secundus]|uniref:dolichyl-P-Man:Man5GlcNAc2-PP-dolichol alpha-1,3-mannosyltransferase n=1 Tax=Cryptotermes secundus TaxID=105785 RepID=A0A2J7QXY6_9NEOP|nr:lethal(2)neighbour of tid protein isoform X1 [Cryptotermes secundus]PNF33442.1 Lethal(2)neighbour of tid protein [Cryptotermes secundus]
MAPHGRQSNAVGKRNVLKVIKLCFEKYLTKQFLYSLVFDPHRLTFVACCLLLAEVVVNILVIQQVKYTEIDWVAYMQEVEGVLNGTFDYTHLKGDTGPLVYPAGFVYIYTVLYYVTNHGQNIRLAQYIFASLYISLLCLVFRIYMKSKKVPPYVLVLTSCSSYRIHSIFVLRLFNDPVAMVLFYASVNLFLDSKWSLASLLYSMAVSVKMNILLFAPAILLMYLTCLGLKGTLIQLTICASVQILLGMPFILTNPIAYIHGAFNLGRVFLYEWTVNWRFMPEDIFTSLYFHMGLLVLHITLLLFFYNSALTCLQSYATLIGIEKKVRRQLSNRTEKVNMDTASQLLLLPLFTANLIGIACSRSLHYQFYVWYFHSLPYLLWSTHFTSIGRLCILGIIELCWNTFPSTYLSSITLHLCHIIILLGLARSRPTLKLK